MIDSTIEINHTKQHLSNVNAANSFTFNNWTWISGIEVIIIFFLLFKLKRSKKIVKNDIDTEYTLIKQARKGKTNMGDMMNNIHQSKALYDKSKVKVHPDRFVGDEEKFKTADILFQSIQEQKHNYKELIKLKRRCPLSY